MDLNPTVYVLIGVFVVLCILYNWNRRKLYMLSSRLPGPFAFPLIGNTLSFACKPEDVLNNFVNLTGPYSSPTRCWLGPVLAILIHHPDQLQAIMQSPKMSTKSFVYRFLEPAIGKGLFTSSGLKHKNDRRLLQPLFASKVLEGYSYMFQKHANKFVEVLETHVNSEKFNILHLLHDSALDTSMDIFVETQSDYSLEYKQIPHYIRRFYHIFSKRVLSFWMYPDWLFKFTSNYQEQQAMLKIINRLSDEVRDAKVPEIKERLECKLDVNKNEEVRPPSMIELMGHMMTEKPDLAEEDFRDHLITFLATSQDTQSSAIAFTLMLLGMYQNIQDKVVQELKEVIGDRKCLDFSDLGKLKYMEMCIKESMRLFPVGPFLLRDVVEDFQLGKWVLPAGCTVVLGIYQVHRNPDFWEKPEEYYPEHFSEEAVAKRHPFAFLPFSAGPRKCIAQQFSYVNMKIILGTILQKYVVECPGSLKDIKIMVDVSIRPINGYDISIKYRTDM